MELSVTENGNHDGECQLALVGRLDFVTAPDALIQVGDRLADHAALSVDLSGVSTANSAGLALMVEWKSLAAESGKSIRFVGVPDSLLSIADICQVRSLLLS